MSDLRYWESYTIQRDLGFLVLRQELWPNGKPIRFNIRRRDFTTFNLVTRRNIDPNTLDPAWVAEAIAYAMTLGRLADATRQALTPGSSDT